jgi:hypothetical protein
MADADLASNKSGGFLINVFVIFNKNKFHTIIDMKYTREENNEFQLNKGTRNGQKNGKRIHYQ